MKEKIIIDAANATLGRLCSFAAKQSLFGKSIIIVNCTKAVITGNRNSVINEFQEARARGGASLRGPFYPKNPERIVKRIIRGMLPYKQERGRLALKRIMCYNEIPLEYKDSVKILAGKEKKIKTMSLDDLGRNI